MLNNDVAGLFLKEILSIREIFFDIYWIDMSQLFCRTYSIFISTRAERWLACRSASICEPPARLYNDISRRMVPIEMERTGHWNQYIPDFRFKRDIQITLFQWAQVFTRKEWVCWSLVWNNFVVSSKELWKTLKSW